MNLLNEKAEHTKFGTGIIKSNENGIIRIQFDETIGEKGFVYPDAFESFLTLGNPTLKEKVQNELKIKYEQIALEKEKQRIESERREEELRAELEQTKLKSRTAKRTKKEKIS